MSTNLRRSSRLAAKATNQTAVPEPAVVVAVVSQPAAAPAVAVSQTAAAPAVVVDQNYIVRTIKKYIDYILNTSGVVKIRLVIEMFEFIDKHFEFMNTVEFQDSKRFVLVIHDKTIQLEQEINQHLEANGESSCEEYNVYIYDVYTQAKKLVQRIHTKCHLYGMDKFVTADPVYKKFLDTYMEKFL